MSKERSWSIIISAIMVVICEVLMTISLCKKRMDSGAYLEKQF